MQLDSGTGIKPILALLFLHMLSIGMTQMVVPLYSLTLGASPVELGIIVGALGVAVYFILQWGGGWGQLTRSPETWLNTLIRFVEGWFFR